MIALATYLYNDLTDFKIDRINKRNTAYSEERLQYYTTLYSVVGFFSISIILAFSINFLTGFGSLAFCGLGIAYSHPKIHLKDRFVIKTVVTAIGGVIASLMGSFAVESFSLLVIASSAIVFLFYFVNGPLNDIRDIHGDKQGGRSTIPIVLGVNKSFAIIMITIISIGTIVLLSHIFLDVHLVGMIAGLAVCVYVMKRIIQLSKNYSDKSQMNNVRTLVRNSILFVQLSLWMGLLANSVL
jgi:geranylgeranylglycerol-phosphate geranylgeranyltransferase